MGRWRDALSRITDHGRRDGFSSAFTRRTGSELGFFATAPNRGDLTVRLRPLSARKASVYTIMARVRGRIESELPGVRVEFMQILQDLIGDLALLDARPLMKISAHRPGHHINTALAQSIFAQCNGPTV